MILCLQHHQNVETGWQTMHLFYLPVEILFLFRENFISPIVGDKLVSGCGVRVWAQSGHAVIHKDPEGNMASSNDGCLHMDDVTQEIDTRRPWPLPVLCSDRAERWVEAFRWEGVAQLRLAVVLNPSLGLKWSSQHSNFTKKGLLALYRGQEIHFKLLTRFAPVSC